MTLIIGSSWLHMTLAMEFIRLLTHRLFKDYLVPYYEKYCVHAGSFNKSRGADEFLALARSYPKIGFVQIGGSPR